MDYATIEIVGLLAEEHVPYLAPLCGGLVRNMADSCTFAPDVIEQIAAAEAKGIRRLLVIVDSVGGSYRVGLEIHDHLLSYADRGGEVIVYVRNRASSVAPLVALAGTFIVLDPSARGYLVHAAWSEHGEPAIDRANLACATRIAFRTFLPARELYEMICSRGYSGTLFQGIAAVQTGFADELGSLERARDLAAGRAPIPTTLRRVEMARRAREQDVGLSNRFDNLNGALGTEGFSWPNTPTLYPLSPSEALASRHEMAARNWTAQNGVPAGRFEGVAWSPTLARFCAIGSNGPSGFCVTTSDGTNYAAQTIPAGAYKGICWDPAAGKYIAVG
jgi:ATP-dependent protease ClpP protease subunit